VDQLHEIGSVDRAEEWIQGALDRGERLMGFGHRVYRAYDPRAAALRKVAESMTGMADWLDLAVKVEDIALRLLAERHPERPLKRGNRRTWLPRDGETSGDEDGPAEKEWGGRTRRHNERPQGWADDPREIERQVDQVQRLRPALNRDLRGQQPEDHGGDDAV